MLATHTVIRPADATIWSARHQWVPSSNDTHVVVRVECSFLGVS